MGYTPMVASVMDAKYYGKEASAAARARGAGSFAPCEQCARTPRPTAYALIPTDHQLCRVAQSFFGTDPPLPQAVGWVLCLGFGFGFCAITLGLVKLDEAFSGTKITSEFFNTAGRDVKVGLTAAVIVSQWTWAATLLQSSNVAWQYGVSGPFW